MANRNDHKGEEPTGWVTIKGVHFPKWKDGTIGWQSGEEKLSSHSQHDFQKAIREAKTKEEISKIIKEAGNSGLSEEAMNKVMETAYDRGQELKETKESLQKEYNELHAKLGYTENPDRIAAINRRLDIISKKLDEKIAEEKKSKRKK